MAGNEHVSGEDGSGWTAKAAENFRKTQQAALGGTQSDPNGTKVQSGWRKDPTEALGSGSQGDGKKQHTGRRISDALSGKKNSRER